METLISSRNQDLVDSSELIFTHSMQTLIQSELTLRGLYQL